MFHWRAEQGLMRAHASALLGRLPGCDLAWGCESEQRKESYLPIGWEMEKQFFWILRFSDFLCTFLFHLQHSCLMDDLSWLRLELNTCRCGTGLDGRDPQASGIASVLRGLRHL